MERDKERLVNQVPPPTLAEGIREKLIMVGFIVGTILFGDMRQEPFNHLGDYWPKPPE